MYYRTFLFLLSVWLIFNYVFTCLIVIFVMRFIHVRQARKPRATARTHDTNKLIIIDFAYQFRKTLAVYLGLPEIHTYFRAVILAVN